MAKIKNDLLTGQAFLDSVRDGREVWYAGAVSYTHLTLPTKRIV